MDVLRGVAAFAVVLHHVRVDLWVGARAILTGGEGVSWLDKAAALLSAPTAIFGEAVMLFFLISGFCVHYPNVLRRGEFSVRSYAVRRFLRIYLPYLAAIAFTLGCELLGRQFFGSTVSPSEKYAQSVAMVQNYGPAPGQLLGNPSLWSLPVEMELYLVYPLLLGASAWCGIRRVWIVPAVVSLVAAGLDLAFGGFWAGNFAAYWLIWCAGAWLAEKTGRGDLPPWRSRDRYLLALAGLAVAGGFIPGAPDMMKHYLAAGFFFMALRWCLTRAPRGDWGASGSWRLFVGFGALSYSLYLVHFPFFRLAGAAWVNWFGGEPVSFFIPLAFAIAVIPVAALFYLLVERPSHRLARSLARRWTSRSPQSSPRFESTRMGQDA